jgi:hypothetical protein
MSGHGSQDNDYLLGRSGDRVTAAHTTAQAPQPVAAPAPALQLEPAGWQWSIRVNAQTWGSWTPCTEYQALREAGNPNYRTRIVYALTRAATTLPNDAPYCAKLAGACPDGCTPVTVACSTRKHGDCWRVKQPAVTFVDNKEMRK